jgi:hypothetical protein
MLLIVDGKHQRLGHGIGVGNLPEREIRIFGIYGIS